MIKYFKHIVSVLILLSCKVSQPTVTPSSRPVSIVYTPSVVKWKSKGNEYGVSSYKIQRSKNGKTSWVSLTPTVIPKKLPDSNVYTFQLPKTAVSYFYRIYITMIKGNFPYASDSLYLVNTNLK